MPGEAAAAGAGTAGAGTGAAAATGGAGGGTAPAAVAGAGTAAASGAGTGASGAGTGAATGATGAATGAGTGTAGAGTGGAGTAAGPDWLVTAPAALDLKLPDGVAKTEVLTDYSTAASKWLGKPFTAEAAQDILNSVAPKFAQASAAAQKSQVAEWEKARVADKEVGGANLAAATESARLGLQFASPELKKMLESGYGSHPEMFRLFVKIGQELRQRVSEDRSGVRQVSSGGTGSGGGGWGPTLYDHPSTRAAMAQADRK